MFSKFFLFISSFFCLAQAFAAAGSCTKDRFLWNEAQRLYESNQMLLSAVHFSQLRASDCDAEIASRSWLGYSLALSRLDENGEALRNIETGLQAPSVKEQDKASLRLLKTWIRQEPGSDLTSEQKARWSLWQERFAKEKFTAVLNATSFNADEKNKLSEMQMALQSSPRKSPLTAGMVSALLPGAGQAYVGNYQTAAMAFILNALFLSATVEFARNDLPAAAIASGAVFSVTYVGNILSAVQGANASNQTSRSGAEQFLQDHLFPDLKP